MAVRPLPAEAQPAPAPLRVIQGRRDPRRYVPVAILLLLAAFALVGVQNYLGQQGFELSRLEGEVDTAEERLTLLRARVAQLSSPGRLTDEAAALGLVPAPDPIFLPAPSDTDDRDRSGPPAP